MSTACDVLIIGGSHAGLSAALVLGRARRNVVVIDDGQPRNAVSPGVHSFLSRDGTPPAELLRISRDEIAAYPSVSFHQGTATDARRAADQFVVRLQNGQELRGRKLVLAMGVRDELPAITASRRCGARACCTARTVTAGKCATSRWRFWAAARWRSSARA